MVDASWIGGALARMQEDIAEIKRNVREINSCVQRNVRNIAVHRSNWDAHADLHHRELRYMALWSVVAAVISGMLAGVVLHWLGG